MSMHRRGDARRALVAALFYVICAFAQPLHAQGAGEIRVLSLHGDVRAQMGGVTAPLYADAILQLPATIRTGVDGSLELRQGPTTIAVAGNTELLIPESAAADGLIERVVQIGGNAFYNVGKRETRKLRVETPHLVAIIKGTQFNVAAQADTTTIALYEGRLEVRAPDDSDAVDLYPGQIAIRRSDAVSIRVLRTSTAAIEVPRNAPAAATSDARATQTTAQDVAQSAAVVAVATPPSVDLDASSSVPVDVADLTLDETRGLRADIDADAESAASAIDVDVGLDAGTIAADMGVDLGAGPIDTAVDVTAGLTDSGVNLGVDTGVDVGAIGADIGASANLGAGAIDVGADIGADLGAIGADVGASTDLGNGVIDVGADIDVGGGEITAGIGADVGAGDVDVDLGVGDVAHVDAGVDLQTPGIELDTNVGGLVDANIDVGAGGLDPVVEVVDGVVGAVDGVLGGLLRPRPGR